MEKLNQYQRLILTNQNRILALLDPSHEGVYSKRASIAARGLEGLYDILFRDVSPDDEITPYEICEETSKILDMYLVIQNNIDVFSAEEKKELRLERLDFEGFDANHDKHYYYMKFMVQEMGMYNEWINKVWNSHTQNSLFKYRQMLSAYVEYLKNHAYQLDKDGILSILYAVYPKKG